MSTLRVCLYNKLKDFRDDACNEGNVRHDDDVCLSDYNHGKDKVDKFRQHRLRKLGLNGKRCAKVRRKGSPR